MGNLEFLSYQLRNRQEYSGKVLLETSTGLLVVSETAELNPESPIATIDYVIERRTTKPITLRKNKSREAPFHLSSFELEDLERNLNTYGYVFNGEFESDDPKNIDELAVYNNKKSGSYQISAAIDQEERKRLGLVIKLLSGGGCLDARILFKLVVHLKALGYQVKDLSQAIQNGKVGVEVNRRAAKTFLEERILAGIPETELLGEFLVVHTQ